MAYEIDRLQALSLKAKLAQGNRHERRKAEVIERNKRGENGHFEDCSCSQCHSARLAY